MKKITNGPLDARIMLIGEHPGEDELKNGKPFSGASGWEMDKMLGEAGISRNECFCTNVIHEMPPINFKGKPDTERMFYTKSEAKKFDIEDLNGKFPNGTILEGIKELVKDIEFVQPDIIVPLGSLALWAVTGEIGITNWRGSIMKGPNGIKTIPTYNPAAILNNWPWRWIQVEDFRRIREESLFTEIRKPEWNFIIRPSFSDVMDFLGDIHDQYIACDTETRNKYISCYGIATSKLDALCIPFMDIPSVESYWSLEEEVAITKRLQEVTSREDVRCIFHNGLYDLQYTMHDWGYTPNISDDTMIMQHTCFAGLPKSLFFTSSLCCDYYSFWKGEGKDWDPRLHSPERYWAYNLQDCVYTFECHEKLMKFLDSYDLWEQYKLLMGLFRPTLEMMLRGVRVDKKTKQELGPQLAQARKERLKWFETVLGHTLNPNSNPQMKSLFYEDFGMKEIKDRKTHQPTVNDDALKELARKEPRLRPLTEKIQECRSIRIFETNFVGARLSDDDRMRSSFALLPKTYRFSASKDSFGTGVNLETIPVGVENE